jgi:hypothetical protein
MDYTQLSDDQLADVFGREMGMSKGMALVFIETTDDPSMGRKRAITDLANRAETRHALQKADFAIERFAHQVA